MKYKINDNVNIKCAGVNNLREIIEFQKNVINKMDNSSFFKPLTFQEFSDAINNGKIYLLYHKNEIIGLGVLNCMPSVDVISEYQLNNIDNVGILDSIMIKDTYRGSGLQRQLINYMDNDVVKYNLKYVVATVHPDNVWSLNNLLVCNFEIINKIIIHGGVRYILSKKYT